ncbi:GNAT superfamily N-acetyltransferase [Bacillus tianshenii]|uniref:GNAT superfamily N-acetyltransferase n=1 Tax=Sutcliffiella tianshenii TaxID=1463404 RepID=A0ABS2P3R2_9BACI|nr:GNAT family N-acetyltransferase [Bacillus tianshenii]MBM7621599.1 GNAT superfamily N-acetyltransferase [Bacillus tianshenii]
MEIIELRNKDRLLDQAIEVFWQQWGSEENFKFYEDAILHSAATSSDIPRFYVAVEAGEIIGTYAILRNDLNSRQDLCPWLACLYVAEEHRGKGIGAKLLDHGLSVAAEKGYENLYLTTDIENYYEKYGWKNSGIVYGAGGGSIKLYEKGTAK